MAKKKERHPIKLIQWYNDQFPPIDLNANFRLVIELIVYAKGLENKIKKLK